VEKAFGVVADIRDDKLGPLYKKLNMSKFNAEKEELEKQINSVKEDVCVGGCVCVCHARAPARAGCLTY
jgi:hypothetical protein